LEYGFNRCDYPAFIQKQEPTMKDYKLNEDLIDRISFDNSWNDVIMPKDKCRNCGHPGSEAYCECQDEAYTSNITSIRAGTVYVTHSRQHSSGSLPSEIVSVRNLIKKAKKEEGGMFGQIEIKVMNNDKPDEARRNQAKILNKLAEKKYVDRAFDVIAVPPSSGSYNHMADIVQETDLDLPCIELTKKEDYDKMQNLKWQERHENIQGQITVDDDDISEVQRKNVIVIDDLATSCSTLNECCRALIKAGAGTTGGMVTSRKATVTNLKKVGILQEK
jgi:predicted amidophosphoribosyltransferase